MSEQIHNPRILIVTPEVTYLPEGMGDIANDFSAKAGGLADVSAALISGLSLLPTCSITCQKIRQKFTALETRLRPGS